MDTNESPDTKTVKLNQSSEKNIKVKQDSRQVKKRNSLNKMTDMLARRLSEERSPQASIDKPTEQQDATYIPDNKKLESIKEVSVINM